MKALLTGQKQEMASEEVFAQAIKELVYCLEPRGLLFLGHSESLIGKANHFAVDQSLKLDRLPQSVSW